MIRARLLLVLAGILSVSWFLNEFNFANEPGSSRDIGFFGLLLAFGILLGPILFLSSAIMFVFSFFRVRELPDGRLAYDPTNWHWRILKKAFNVKGNLSLCAAFWMTAGIIFMSVAILLVVVLFSAIIIRGNALALLNTAKQTMPLLALMGSFTLLAALRSIWPNNEKVFKFSLFLLALAAIGWFVVTPLYLFVYRDGLAMSAALSKYLWGVAIVLGVTALAITVFGLLVLLIKYLSSVSPDNLLKRLFLQIYSNLCQILHENSPTNEQ